MSAILAIGTIAMPMSTFAAGGDTLFVSPATSSPTVGSSFTVAVKVNTTVAIHGAGASLTFDNSRLQLTAVNAASDQGSASYAGLPASPTDSAYLASANAAGKIPGIAWFLTSSTEPASVDHGIFTATFQAIAPGTSSLDIPIGPSDGNIIDLNGDTITDTTSVSGSVVTPVPPTPTPTPTAPPPPASAAPGSGTTSVSGSLDSGFLGITVPASATMPLVRNATNAKVVQVTVFSNIVWNLNVNDLKVVHKGHMTDASSDVLSNPMFVQIYDSTNTLVNSVNLETGGLLWYGANSTNVNATLSQFVAPQDKPGSYEIDVNFAAVSGF